MPGKSLTAGGFEVVGEDMQFRLAVTTPIAKLFDSFDGRFQTAAIQVDHRKTLVR